MISRSELEYILSCLESAEASAKASAKLYNADPERQASYEAGALRGEIKCAAMRLRSLLATHVRAA